MADQWTGKLSSQSKPLFFKAFQTISKENLKPLPLAVERLP
jgi:hypothetical protein